jgi:hypothetical protein
MFFPGGERNITKKSQQKYHFQPDFSPLKGEGKKSISSCKVFLGPDAGKQQSLYSGIGLPQQWG